MFCFVLPHSHPRPPRTTAASFILASYLSDSLRWSWGHRVSQSYKSIRTSKGETYLMWEAFTIEDVLGYLQEDRMRWVYGQGLRGTERDVSWLDPRGRCGSIDHRLINMPAVRLCRIDA